MANATPVPGANMVEVALPPPSSPNHVTHVGTVVKSRVGILFSISAIPVFSLTLSLAMAMTQQMPELLFDGQINKL